MRAMLLVASLCAAFGACTALPPSKTEALGPPFNEDAKQGYVALASSEWDAGDWDFLHFDRKATDAMLGDEVWPDRVASRRMPASARQEMLVQRAKLVDALQARARRQSPREAAKAQVAFDCWLDEVGASGQPSLETGCKDAFTEQLALVEAKLYDVPDMYAVFFETSSALLSVQARNTISDAVRAVRFLKPQRVDVVGFADAAGSTAYNESLANDRALAVVEGLLQAGVPADLISPEARGAAGGETAAENRRVEIALVR